MNNLNDPAVFEMLYKQYFSMLVGFAYQYVEDAEVSEDIVQDSFGRIWKQSETLNIRTNVKSYLFGVVRNACLNHLRHQKVIQIHKRETKPDDTESTDFLEMDELQATLEKGLAKLPDKRRQIFELSRFEGKKYHEIADQLNISVKTVETQMSRALKAIREALSSYLVVLIILSMVFIEACRGKM